MATEAVVAETTPANGTGQQVDTKESSTVSGINLGQLLDERGLASIIEKQILNEEGSQEADSPAPDEGKTEPEKTDSEEPASAETNEADESSTDTTDLSKPETEEEDSLPEGVKKRFAKLTAKRREAEEALADTRREMESLREEVESLRTRSQPTPAAVPGQNPFQHLTKQSDVEGEIRQARQVRRWCEENPDGAVVKGPDGKEREYTAEEIRSIKLNAIDALEEHLPKQLSYIAELHKYDNAAEQVFPWWRERASPIRQQAEQLLAQAPELKRFPNYKMFLGDYLLGVAYREQQSKAKAQKAPIKRAPAQPTKPSPQPPAADPKKDLAGKAVESFLKTRSERDLQQVILNKFL